MKFEDTVTVKLDSGTNVVLSGDVHDECFCAFDETKYLCFSNMINSGLYFPQIMQFIYVLVGICKGRTSFKDIFLASLLTGVFYTILWFWVKIYRLIPGINAICCFFGATIFKYLLHFVVIAIVALAVVGDWKIILYCLICGIITSLIRSILFVKLSTVKYNDEVAIYVSKFKTSL